jgi:hypothetical protein
MAALGLKISMARMTAQAINVVTTALSMWHKFTATTWSGGNRLPDSSPVGTNTASLNTGEALSFDGVNDVVTIGNTAASVRTVVFYVNPASTTQSFMQLQSSGAVRVQIASGTLTATGFTSPSLYVNGAASSTVAASAWQMIAVTSATALTASNVLLGQQNTTFYQGSLANVKLFSTQLTAGQIAELYANPEMALPTGSVASDLQCWWPICEGVGIYTSDQKGGVKNGSISGATWQAAQPLPLFQPALMSQTQMMYFDGANDYISLGNQSTPATTFSFNLIMRFDVANKRVFSFGKTMLELGNTSTSYFPDVAGGAVAISNSITIGQTIHFGIAQNGTNLKVYLNGALISTKTGTPVLSTTSFASALGTYGSSPTTIPFTGLFYEAAVWSTELSATDYANLYARTVVPTDISGCMGWWKNRGISNAAWADLSGNGRNGTVNGSPAFALVLPGTTAGFDTLGNAMAQPNANYLALTGDGYASVADAASLDITTAITIEAWVRPNQVSAAQTIVGKNTSYALNITSGAKLQFSKWTSAANATLASTASIVTTAWTHVAVTYTSGTCRLYVNGAQDTTSAALTGALDVTTTAVLLGALTTSSQQFTGQIDSVKVYSSALAAADIAKNYAAERSQYS